MGNSGAALDLQLTREVSCLYFSDRSRFLIHSQVYCFK